MKKKNSEDFIQDAFDNICSDRKKLEDLYTEVSKVAKLASDALGLASVSENLVKITDSLTKQTGQVVELAKLKQKAELIQKKPDDEEITDKDISDFYSDFEDENELDPN